MLTKNWGNLNYPHFFVLCLYLKLTSLQIQNWHFLARKFKYFKKVKKGKNSKLTLLARKFKYFKKITNVQIQNWHFLGAKIQMIFWKTAGKFKICWFFWRENSSIKKWTISPQDIFLKFFLLILQVPLPRICGSTWTLVSPREGWTMSFKTPSETIYT